MNMVAVQNLKGEIINLYFHEKGRGACTYMYLVNSTPTKLLIEFL
jgi:hypothetical protein